MLEKTIRFAQQALSGGEFTCSFTQDPPPDSGAITHLAEVLKGLGCEMPSSLRSFYQMCNGLTLRWTYNKLTHPDYITAGNIKITSITMLTAVLHHASHDPATFDNISDMNQVLVRVEEGVIKLFYYDERLDEELPLALDVDAYFRLLDESRGLYPWQELFVVSPSFQLDPVLRAKFFSDLSLLFADADAEAFKQA